MKVDYAPIVEGSKCNSLQKDIKYYPYQAMINLENKYKSSQNDEDKHPFVMAKLDLETEYVKNPKGFIEDDYYEIFYTKSIFPTLKKEPLKITLHYQIINSNLIIQKIEVCYTK